MTALQALLIVDARGDRHQQQGTRWTTKTTTMMMTTTRTRTRTTTRTTEGEDTVVTEEGIGRGGTSGGRNK